MTGPRPTIGSMETARTCAKCGEQPIGPGGVLCLDCLTLLAQRARDYWREPDSTTEDGD